MNSYTKQVPVHAIKTKEMGPSGFGIIDLFGTGGKAYDSSVPHRHTFFELLFFTQAQGKHEIDFNNFDVENNSVHLVSPGQIHKLSLKKNRGYVLCFTEDFISLKSKGRFTETFPFYELTASPVMALKKDLSAQLQELINSINKEIYAGDSYDLDICRSYLTIILLKLKSVFQEKYKNSKPALAEKNKKVEQFKKLIDAEYLSNKSVSSYAGKLTVSPNHLNALCKKQEGKTATQIIQERILLESKRLLYATDMHIKEISYYLQFEDVPYFNRFFKKQTRLTPLAYRSQFQHKSLKSARAS
jgi:AraC-like DNA-binding protein